MEFTSMNDPEKCTKAKDVDAGWNDPPVFTYDTHQSYSRQTKGIALNKRVVFPMSPSAAQGADCSSTNIISPSTTLSTPPPPSGLTTGPPKIATSSTSSHRQLPVEDTKEDSDVPNLDITLRYLFDILQKVSPEEEKESIEIKRRLSIMEKMWMEEKFNALIKEKIYKLSIALKEDRLDDSDSLQRSLMVDHSNVCSTWMAAIRKLIYLKKELPNS